MAGEYAERFREVREVGAGNYGEAHAAVAVLVESLSDKRLLVAKKVHLNMLKEKARKAVLYEVMVTQATLLRSLKHFNIVSYEENFMNEDELIILMEYCPGGDLGQVLQSLVEPLPEAQILTWFTQMSLALNYLHKRQILHRDIKPSNIYLTASNDIKLGDFGIAKALENSADVAYSITGTPNYMSPELAKNQPYSKKSDVWALGCVLYEMCTLHRAFDGGSVISVLDKVINHEPQQIGERYSPGVRKLVE